MESARCLNQRLRSIGTALVILFCGVTAHAGSVIWDYPPGNGDTVCCWSNFSNSQNFADSFTLPTNSRITEFNLFTGNFPPIPGGRYDVHLYGDSGGVPGSLIGSQSVSASSFSFYGTFNGVDIYEAVIPIAAINVLGGVQYWIGASGIGFEAGQVSLKGPGDPGDGQMAQFSGPAFQAMVTIGDQSFQLIGDIAEVPEPGSLVLLTAGLGTWAGIFRRTARRPSLMR